MEFGINFCKLCVCVCVCVCEIMHGSKYAANNLGISCFRIVAHPFFALSIDPTWRRGLMLNSMTNRHLVHRVAASYKKTGCKTLTSSRPT